MRTCIVNELCDYQGYYENFGRVGTEPIVLREQLKIDDIIGPKRGFNDIDSYKSYNEVDVNDYDKVYVYGSNDIYYNNEIGKTRFDARKFWTKAKNVIFLSLNNLYLPKNWFDNIKSLKEYITEEFDFNEIKPSDSTKYTLITPFELSDYIKQQLGMDEYYKINLAESAILYRNRRLDLSFTSCKYDLFYDSNFNEEDLKSVRGYLDFSNNNLVATRNSVNRYMYTYSKIKQESIENVQRYLERLSVSFATIIFDNEVNIQLKEIPIKLYEAASQFCYVFYTEKLSYLNEIFNNDNHLVTGPEDLVSKLNHLQSLKTKQYQDIIYEQYKTLSGRCLL